MSTPMSIHSGKRAEFPSLRGRRVLVTGGATGIGAALVEAFSLQGAVVAFVDIDAVASQALATRLQAPDRTIWWQVCDVADLAALRSAISAAASAVGDFDVLVNNVANDDRHDLESVSAEYWDRCMAVNERASFFAIQAVVAGMKRLGGGSIVNIGSTGWQNKNASYPCYSIAKSSVNGLTRGLAQSLGADRIRINTVSPGWVMTEKQLRLWVNADAEREITRNQCLPDRVQPEDVAAMVLFLASDDARMCSAQEFVVDGGWR